VKLIPAVSPMCGIMPIAVHVPDMGRIILMVAIRIFSNDWRFVTG
jgi:hypothetical protein